MFYKWGRFAYRHRRVIPVLVIALILAMQVLFGSKLGERLSQDCLLYTSDAADE